MFLQSFQSFSDLLTGSCENRRSSQERSGLLRANLIWEPTFGITGPQSTAAPQNHGTSLATGEISGGIERSPEKAKGGTFPHSIPEGGGEEGVREQAKIAVGRAA
jgi:hypothetical protein